MDGKRQEVILHIGHAKTGSSYIQSSLARSVDRLRHAGIEYPELTSFANAKLGGISSGNLDFATDFVTTVGEAARRHATMHRLLFSSEWLFSRISEDGTTLADLGKSFDVTVVLFLREFLGHAISGYGQSVKRAGCTLSLGDYLAQHRLPDHVLRVLRAVEDAGCRLAVFNYSRHADHLLDVFATAIGVPPGTLVRPPVSRVNRSLDEAELCLARSFNAVLGASGSELVADALCERLPDHPSGPRRISRHDYETYRARVAPLEQMINLLLPPSERYGADEPILIEDDDVDPVRVMGFSEPQMRVLAEALGGEIGRLRTPRPGPRRPEGRVARVLRRLADSLSELGEGFSERHIRRVVSRSPLFDAEWYAGFYPDVKAAGVDPLQHFVERGAPERRLPSVHFDTAAYLDRYPDVRTSGVNPLYHYLQYGKREGRHIRPVTARPEFFDSISSARWVEALRSHRAHAETASRQPLVSVILPTKDRADVLPAAIRSVLAQTWANWELLVVDDGSVDDSIAMVRRDFPDPRINVLRSTGRGVCDARNCGLAAARGASVAYLDSDNTWTPQYLELTLAELARSGADAVYAVLEVCDTCDASRPPAFVYRRQPFDYELLQVENFIDVNVFMHRRELYEQLGGFDADLRRMVDWDLILRYTAGRKVAFANFVGCHYTQGPCPSRITNRESVAYVNVVRNKHLIDWARVRKGIVDRDPRLVSVIVCNFERADLTRLCIESLHRHEAGESFEVILVENGSDPQTVSAIEKLVGRYRGVRLVRNPKNYGFALGNNIGFAESRGGRVVFLNNDTEVTPEWLRSLVRPLADPDIKGTQPKLLHPDGSIQCVGVVFPRQSPMGYPIYAGRPGDFRPTQQSRNYQAITAACMAMRAEDFAAAGGFDPLFLNGQEDVDLCLRIGGGRRAFRVVADSIVVHHEGQTAGRGANIRTNRELFHDRWKDSVRADDASFYAEDGEVVGGYQPDNPEWAEAGYAVWRPSDPPAPSSAAPRRSERLRGRTIAIKVPCPAPDVKDHWGDYHFAVSLAQALFRKGVPARIDFLRDWCACGSPEDVNLVLRGLSRFTPVPGTLNLMWMISHPDKVSLDELRAYDGVFVASTPWAEALRRDGLSHVTTMLQCTDACRFHPGAFSDARRTKNLFVANSRRVLRPVVRAARDENIPLDIYGEMWEGLAPQDWIRADKIDNVDLAASYASAEVVLNDHWDSMRERGFVSNRVFDVLASGGSLVTDRVEGLPEQLAAACHFFEPDGSLANVMERARRDPRQRSAASLDLAEHVRREHSFDARAAAILEAIDALIARRAGDEGPGLVQGNPGTVPAVRPRSDGVLSPPIPPQKMRFMGESDEGFVRAGDEMVARIGTLVDLARCARVVDIGCGYGRIAAGFIRCERFTGRYDGFDLLQRHLAWCSEHLGSERFAFHSLPIHSERYNPTGTLRQTEVRFDVPDGAADLVVLTSVFTHMYPDDVVHYLHECRRMLGETGRVYATFFMMNDRQGSRSNVYPLPHAHTPFCRFMDREQPLHVIAYTEEWLRAQFAAAGLRVEGPIRQGAWSGEPDAFCFQDTVVLARSDGS